MLLARLILVSAFVFAFAFDASADPLTDVVRAVAAGRGEEIAADVSLSSAPAAPAPKNLGVLRPLLAAEGNPYLARLVAGARDYLDRPETAADWPKLAPKDTTFFVLQGSNDRDTRGTAARLDALLWLFAHPTSPLRHDPAILGFFLRRAHAYCDGLEQASAADTLKAGALLLDDFAIAPASAALREFAALYPGLLAPEQRARWDRALRLAADAMLGKADGRPGNYANIDLALSVQLLNFGLHFNDEKLLARSRELLLAQAANILPDGGTHYIWSQNESPGYHDVVAWFIARTHEITGDEAALAMLRRLEWYGPVSVGPRGEYWTSPSWKHTWNGGETSAGGEPVVSVTGNPWVRGLVVPPAPEAPFRGWENARAGVAWWRADVSAKPLPDNYTLLDRNIAGPRAWYGNFNYAATLRDIPLGEPGHATLLGAQVTGADFARGVYLMGVAPRVHLGGDRANPRSFAWLTSGLRSDLALGRTWSAFAADYKLHVFGSSTKGKTVPWRGRQLWLCLPDRLVGVLDLAPESAATPPATLEGLVRLGIGGTVTGPRQTLVKDAPDRYRFGDLRVIVHASDFAELAIESTPFRLPRAPCSDLVLRDRAPTAAARRFVVEIRPATAAGDARVRAADQSGYAALRVELGEKTFTLRRAAPADPSALSAFAPLHVEVASPDPEDLAPAWPDFATLAASRP